MTLRAFFTQLSVEFDTLARFIIDPASVIEMAKLGPRDRLALEHGSASDVWKALMVGDGQTTSRSPTAMPRTRRSHGSLTVVGTGIRTVGQLTIETLSWLRAADVVYYLVADPIAEEVIRYLNPMPISLHDCYVEGAERAEAYEEMVERILESVRAGRSTCAALYGHPGVIANPSHEAVRRARQEGYPAQMLPAVSAEDCLFADLGIDPGRGGCQTFEASDFLLRRIEVDPACQLVLWQADKVCDNTYQRHRAENAAFSQLVARLVDLFGPMHPCLVYGAARLPTFAASVRRIQIDQLRIAHVGKGSTLYLPPVHS